MTNAVRCALSAVVVCASACSDPALPTAPTPPAASAATATPQPPGNPPPAFPDVTKAARVYLAADWPASTYHGGSLASRYVLYDDGTFTLQYASANYTFFEYRGTYIEADGVITFHWEGWSAAGSWGARGSITPERLVVHYNEIMTMSDFVDGVYLRR